MTRNGKIARLPQAVREELNRRLEDGEQGIRLVEWLNGLPEVKAVIDKDFEGVPITEINVSLWKRGGFLDWQARQRAESMLERWRGESQKAEGRRQKAENSAMSKEVSEALTEQLMVHYAAALEDAIAESDEKASNRVDRLGKSLRDMLRVRRHDLDREWCAAEQERVKMERERLELLRAKLQPEANAELEDGKEPPLSHQEKAEMVKQMVREAKERMGES